MAALVCGGVALAAAALLAGHGSQAPLQTLVLLLLSLALAWSYSSPPLWLNRRGLGRDHRRAAGAGADDPAGLSGAGRPAGAPCRCWRPLPLCCFQFAMLLSVNFPDPAGDARVNKRTLVVIHGPRRAGAALPGRVGAGLPAAAGAGPAWTAGAGGAGRAADRADRGLAGAAHPPRRGHRSGAWDALGFWSIGLLMSAALLEMAAFVALNMAG